MAYKLRYFLQYYSDKDTRLPDVAPDSHELQILEDGYGGMPEEIEGQESPFNTSNPNTDVNKFEAFRGSEGELNLIATELNELNDLSTENERKFLVIDYITRANQKFTVGWSNNDLGGTVESFLQVYVNNVLVVDSFTTESGSFEVNKGDNVSATVYSVGAWPSGKNGLELKFSGEVTQRTTVNATPLSKNNIVLQSDIIIQGYSTHSATDFRAIRSQVFYKANNQFPVTFTKAYTSATSQAGADALAAADTGFDAEGQAYAEAYSLDYPIAWRGFVIPDDGRRAFTFTPYPMQVNATDGLGLLKNFSFVRNDGTIYFGKMSFMEVIYACLNRLQIPNIVLNTCVNVFEVTMTQSDANDPFALSFVNAERYFKDDGFTPMNCQEVLESVLQEWRASIMQSEGQWWIFRPNEVALSGTLAFRRYIDGVRDTEMPVVNKNINVLLGGESEGEVLAPLFHIDEDQETINDRPYKNASISYKYGLVASEIVNPNFTGWNGVVFPDWTRSNVLIDLSEDPLGGAKIGGTPGKTAPYYYISNSTPASGAAGDIFNFTLNFYNYRADGPRWAVILTDGVSTYYLSADGSWGTAFNDNVGVTLYYYEGSIQVLTQPLPIAGDITFRLYEASDLFDIAPSTDLFITYRKADLQPVLDEFAPIGEIHTATQANDFSFVPDTLSVFNGDNISEQKIGGIYREDETTLTTLWNRRGIAESALATPYAAEKPFLRIAVEETQRMYANPVKRYEGTIFGYFNPLSRFAIRLLDGYYIPLSMQRNHQTNKTKVVLGRVVNEEIEQAYTLQADFGETTKVTIK